MEPRRAEAEQDRKLKETADKKLPEPGEVNTQTQEAKDLEGLSRTRSMPGHAVIPCGGSRRQRLLKAARGKGPDRDREARGPHQAFQQKPQTTEVHSKQSPRKEKATL